MNDTRILKTTHLTMTHDFYIANAVDYYVSIKRMTVADATVEAEQQWERALKLQEMSAR